MSTAEAQELRGDWSLDLDSGLPAWMSIQESEGKPLVSMRFYVGSAGPYGNVEKSNGRLKFTLKEVVDRLAAEDQTSASLAKLCYFGGLDLEHAAEFHWVRGRLESV